MLLTDLAIRNRTTVAVLVLIIILLGVNSYLSLPRAKERIIKEADFAETPIMYISISGDVSPVQLKFIADHLHDEIETVPGVLKAQIMGALEREIRLEFDPDRLASYSLTLPKSLR